MVIKTDREKGIEYCFDSKTHQILGCRRLYYRREHCKTPLDRILLLGWYNQYRRVSSLLKGIYERIQYRLRGFRPLSEMGLDE